MLYINEPSVIVGKHQNALAEINYKFVKENNIKVVRRLSGGGTVFHDYGNLNFCFIQKGEKDKLVDFRKYTKPILEVLNQLNVPARFSGKSDLVIGNKKFSGNAEHVYRNKVMHHGTILYNSAISNLSQAIKIDPFKYHDKAVKSNRSMVTNVIEYLDKKYSTMEFIMLIFKHIQSDSNDFTNYELTGNDTNKIQELAENKYAQWEWNFGYSPKYQFVKKFNDGNDDLKIQFNVEKGIIQAVHLDTNVLNLKEVLGKIEKEPHNEAALMQKIASVIKETKILGMSIEEFVEQLF